MAYKTNYPHIYIKADILKKKLLDKAENEKTMRERHCVIIMMFIDFLLAHIQSKNLENIRTNNSFDIKKPIEFFVKPKTILEIIDPNRTRRVSLATIKNNFSRLHELGFIKRRYDIFKKGFWVSIPLSESLIMDKKGGSYINK